MILAIDCFKLVKGVGKSIGIYNLTKNLVTNLAKTNQNKEHCNRILIFGNAFNREDFDVTGVEFIQIPHNPKDRKAILMWELFSVVKFLHQYHVDRVLFPRGFRPLFCDVKDAIIIHDMIPFFYHEYYPNEFNKLENAYIMLRLKASIRHADQVITISEYSQKEILDKVPSRNHNISVIYNGVNAVSFEKKNSESNEYLVAMTSALPHKNAKGVLKTYQKYFEKEMSPLDLVVIGIDQVDSYVQLEANVKKHIRCIKYMDSFQDVCNCIAGARAFLFLSYAEGFGFPPIEAMQMSVPVICSNRSSLPEVIGEAGLLVDPDRVQDTVEAIIKVQHDEKLREELIAKGIANQNRFSWDSQILSYWEVLCR